MRAIGVCEQCGDRLLPGDEWFLEDECACGGNYLLLDEHEDGQAESDKAELERPAAARRRG